MADRYVLLGLAPARAEWFRAVSHWCNGASVPAEFVKCVSPEQVRALLASGRAFSAAVLDAGAPGLDRDLLDAAARAGVPVLLVGSSALSSDAAATLPQGFGPDHLLDALAAVARPVGPVDAGVLDRADGTPASPWRGRVIAVCGPGGTGVSTACIALAQGLSGRVLLADLRLHAEQAMLHDARDVVPGVQELVEAHRARRPAPDEVARLAYRVEERGYDLLLGLRRSRMWPALRPRAFEAGFDALRAGWQTVVCDVDVEVEGERECGSADVEERNVMARTVFAAADLVFVVGVPGMKGLSSLVRVVNELVHFGVGAKRIVPVVNRAPRSPRARAELARALAGLVASPLAAPVFLPDRRVDELLRDGGRLPPVLTGPLASAADGVTARPVRRGASTVAVEPERIVPGSLGTWAEG